MPTWKKKTISHISHPYEPVFSPTSKILILGTIPSPASRKNGFYYMHPQNRFWLIMEKVFGIEFKYKNNEGQKAIAERKNFLLDHDIALWDVIRSCDIKGNGGEGNIKNAKANNFFDIFMKANIVQIFCLGATAYKYWNNLCKYNYDKSAICLPSTSPWNQIYWNTDKLVEEYKKAILPVLNIKETNNKKEEATNSINFSIK